MQDLILIIIIYYFILLILVLLSLRNYFTFNDYLIVLFLFLIFLSFTLTCLGMLTDLQILSLDNNTQDCLEALEYSIELPELDDNLIRENIKETKSKNFILKFLELFRYDSNNNSVNISTLELKNSFYISNLKNKAKYSPVEWSQFIDNATSISLENKRMLYLIGCVNDALDEIESIENSLKQNN